LCTFRSNYTIKKKSYTPFYFYPSSSPFNLFIQNLRNHQALFPSSSLKECSAVLPVVSSAKPFVMLLACLAPTAFSTHGAPKASTASQAAAGRPRRLSFSTMLAEGLPKAVVFDLDGCLWSPDMCA
jgi:hypothetical protein